MSDTYQDYADESKQPILLCIDDDPQILEALQLRLAEYDVDVRTACHGMHGLYEAQAKKPDLIITDMRMPQGEGDYLVECLRGNTERRSVPIIMLTGQRDPDLEGRMFQLGVQEYFSKPVQFDKLREAITQYIPLRKRNLVEYEA